MSNLADLEIFAKVASSGSMSVAARALGHTPAVVSKRIMRLESRLGARLLQRTTRKVIMTEAGEGFYQRILGVLEGLRDAEGFISGQADQMRGTLKVSAPTSFGRLHVAPHVWKLLDQYPKLELKLVLTDEFSDLIGEGFDLAIRIGSSSDSMLIAKRLAAVRRVLCASPEYLKRYGAPSEFANLRSHRCLAAHNGEPWRLEGPSGSLLYRPDANLQTNSSEVVREAALSGAGIALRPTWEIAEDLRSGRLLRVLPELEGARDLTVSAVYPTRSFLPAKVRGFIDYISSVFGEAPYWEDQR